MRRLASAIERRDGFRLWVGGPVPPGADAITLGSLVIVRRGHERSEKLLRHEREHVEQYARLGFVGFLRRYLAAYLRWRVRGYGHRGAYLRIPLEAAAEWRARRGLGLGVAAPGDPAGPATPGRGGRAPRAGAGAAPSPAAGGGAASPRAGGS